MTKQPVIKVFITMVIVQLKTGHIDLPKRYNDRFQKTETKRPKCSVTVVMSRVGCVFSVQTGGSDT